MNELVAYLNDKRTGWGKNIFLLILQCVIAVEILIWIAVFPMLFENLSFNLSKYLMAIYKLNVRVFTLSDFFIADGKHSLFPDIIYRYLDSMKILGLGIMASFCISLVVSYIFLIFFKNKINYFKSFLEILEAIPDLMLVLFLQFTVIFIYQKTGIKIAQVVTVQEKAILLPVISLSVPVSFFMTKVIFLSIEAELEKQYVMLAKAKGFTLPYILKFHVLRNIADGLFGTSKTIFWTMLSTLVVVDYLFNMNGLLRIMLTSTDPFFIGCILIFVPFFIVYRIYD